MPDNNYNMYITWNSIYVYKVFEFLHESHLLIVYEHPEVEVNADGNPGFFM